MSEDIVFSELQSTSRDLVFGAVGTDVLAPGDLVFSALQTASTDLVFGGGDDTPGATDSTVALVVTLPGLSGAITTTLGFRVGLVSPLPALTLAATVVYDTSTARPLAAQVSAPYQDGDDLSAGVKQHWQDAIDLFAGVVSHYQQSEHLRATTDAKWQDAARRRVFAASRYQRGLRTNGGTTSGFQNGIRIKTSASSAYQDGIGLRQSRTSGFRDGLRDRRNGTAVLFQDSLAYLAGVWARSRRGRRFNVGWETEYQDAMRPPPGIWVRPGPEPQEPCYLPLVPAHLVFAEGPGGPHLVYVCERHGPGPDPEPGDTVVVPIKEVYLVINSAVLIRVDGAVPIPTLSMSMSLDVDSWTWSFSASVPGYALADIEPEDGVPVAVQATINGTPYRFIVESIARDRTFGRSDLRIGGRGRAAVLDAPYAPIMSFGNEFGRTAQQIMGDILTDNGVPLGWDVEWNPDDWNVPAGVFNHQGSYISAMNSVAGSIAAYLQPHNTDEVLRVLSRYPVAPWDWAGVTPDFELPSAVMTREGVEWRDKARYNRVFVMGQQVGVNGRVSRTGTAGDYLAPTIVDPLITQAAAARQRGLAVLSDTGRIASVSLRMPVLAETGIIKPGNFVLYDDNGTERIGITRSVQVEVGLPSIWQTIGVETHVEPL